jgi:hypothetical protein
MPRFQLTDNVVDNDVDLLYKGIPVQLRVLIGSTLWVSNSSDGNDATAVKGRIDRPYKTIQAAINAFVAGDIIKVMPGAEYKEGVANTWLITVPDNKEVTIDISGCRVFKILLGNSGSRLNLIGDGATRITDSLSGAGSANVYNIGFIQSLPLHWGVNSVWNFYNIGQIAITDIRCTANFYRCNLVNPNGPGLNTWAGGLTSKINLFHCNVDGSTNGVTNTHAWFFAQDTMFIARNGVGIDNLAHESTINRCTIRSTGNGINCQVASVVSSSFRQQIFNTTIFSTGASANSIYMAPKNNGNLNILNVKNLITNRVINVSDNTLLQNNVNIDADFNYFHI